MPSSECLVRMPRSAIRYRPLDADTQQPSRSRVSRQSSPQLPQKAIASVGLSARQIMPGWCFVVLGMMISFVLLYIGSVIR
jgi:hypothetical protein